MQLQDVKQQLIASKARESELSRNLEVRGTMYLLFAECLGAQEAQEYAEFREKGGALGEVGTNDVAYMTGTMRTCKDILGQSPNVAMLAFGKVQGLGVV